MVPDFDRLSDLMHNISRGCMNDFNQNKREDILKLRTADLCPDCSKQLIDMNINKDFVNQVFQFMEAIRSNILYRERFALTQKPSRLLIKGIRKDIFFSDIQNCALRLTPLEKTVYLLFLKYPD